MDPLLATRLRDSIRKDLEERLGEICVARGLLTQDQLRRASGEPLPLAAALAKVEPGAVAVLDEVLAAPAGRRLGRYEVIREIGRGGIGTVSKAYDTVLRRVVALKTIRPGALSLENLSREAQALAGLRHPNVVTVYDVGEADGTPFISMEHVEGEPLRRGDRSLEAAVEVLRKAAEGVAAAHARGIVHRDLKPGNVLVDAAGEPRVIDFGLARHLDRKALLAATGSPAGTPYYMSPEQVARPGSVGPASDVYSLGVCLYELMTGRRPFEGSETYAVFERILRGDPAPPRSLRADLPADLETICLKAMDRDPRRRYPDAGALAADLGRFLRREPIEARPLTGFEKLARRLARRRAALGAAAAALLLALAAGWAVHSSARYRRLRERLDPLEAQVRETRPFFYIAGADVAARLREVESALGGVEELAREHPGAADPWKALGAGWYFAGDLPRAEAALRRAEAIAPGDGEVHRHLGRICLDRAVLELFTHDGRGPAEKRSRSKEWNRKALDHSRRGINPAAGELEGLLAAAVLAVAEENAAAARTLCAEGLARFGGQLGAEEFSCLLGSISEGAERIEHLTRALERRPHYPWAFLLRGDARLQAGDPGRAASDFDRALALHPRIAHAWNDRGVARLQQERFEEALADFAEALRLDPGNAFTIVNRALARMGRGDLDGAIADCDRAIGINPSVPQAWQNRGVIRQRRGETELAIADYGRAIDLAPDHAPAWYDRGLARASTKDWARAIADHTRAIELDPLHVPAHVARGIARVEAGESERAFEDFDRALRLDPRQGTASYYRGTIRVERQELDSAMADFDDAIRLAPAFAPAYVSRAVVWESRGEFDRAIEDCTAALRIDPRYADAHFNRGAARLEKGQVREAIADLERSLELAPPGWNSRALALRYLEAARKGRDE